MCSNTPDELALAARLIAQLDVPKPTYRLTFTLNESDNGQRIGSQHFFMVVVGQRNTLKQGDKVPVATGSFDSGKSTQETQITYLDVGINLDATLDRFANGLRFRSRVEQSSVAPSQPSNTPQDPIVRQAVLEGTSLILPG